MSLYWSAQALTLARVKDKLQEVSLEEFKEWLEGEISRVSEIALRELGEDTDSSDVDYDPEAYYD